MHFWLLFPCETATHPPLPTIPGKGYSWQPQIGWHSMFVDDLQGGAGRGTEFRDRGRKGKTRCEPLRQVVPSCAISQAQRWELWAQRAGWWASRCRRDAPGIES